jgi:hypothetical protein
MGRGTQLTPTVCSAEATTAESRGYVGERGHQQFVHTVAHHVLLGRSSATHNQENTTMTTNTVTAFESIDLCLLSDVTGGEGQANDNPNFLQRWGRNMQSGGEYAMAAGAVGTVVPGLGETGIPEGVAAGGGASWLIGKGIEGVGSLFR